MPSTEARSKIVEVARGIATFGSVGYIPVAPGTFGTLAALPLAYYAQHLDTWLYVVLIALLAIVGALASEIADQSWGSNDSQKIVIDEVVGYLIATVPLDRSHGWPLFVAFVLFRLFDIVKPPPIGWIDRKVKGGIGVMLDDVVAGVMAAVLAYLVLPHLA